MKNFVVLSLLSYLLVGCSTITKTQVQEVYIPTKCISELPVKPKEDGSFESAKNLSIYYIKIEQILRDCVKGK